MASKKPELPPRPEALFGPLFEQFPVGLAIFSFTSAALWPGLLTVLFVSAAGGVLTINLQLRLMHVAGDAKTIGAALNHSSLNIANALGAWLGGLVIAAGWGYTATSWVGVALSAAGLLLLARSVLLHRRDVAVTS